MLPASSIAPLVTASFRAHADVALYAHHLSMDPSLMPVFMFVTGVGLTVAGISAYSGRWRSWSVRRPFIYPRGRYTMLGCALLGPGLLLMQSAMLVPKPVGRPIAVLALALLSLGTVGIFYIPQRLLPRWFRAAKGLDRGPLRLSAETETTEQWLQRIDTLTARGSSLAVSSAGEADIIGRSAEPCGGAFIGAFIGGSIDRERVSSQADGVRARSADVLVRGFEREPARSADPGSAA